MKVSHKSYVFLNTVNDTKRIKILLIQGKTWFNPYFYAEAPAKKHQFYIE